MHRISAFGFNNAIVRLPATSVTHGLRAIDRGAPDYTGVMAEHLQYIEALSGAGITVDILPALEDFPDSMFVEDVALVFQAGAILLRPGTESRFGETAHITATLQRHFTKILTLANGYVDGGDVLVTPEKVMIGLSDRTNQQGAEALCILLAELGYTGAMVTPPPGVLHFKTACSLLDEDTILSTPALAAAGVFDRMRVILTPQGEEGAANALRINDQVLVSAEYPGTADMLESQGYKITRLSTAQIAKIDAGLSCMSLRWYKNA